MGGEPNSTFDPYEYFQVVLNPDGSLTRNLQFPAVPATPTSDPNNPVSVLSQDLTFNPSNDHNWLRIYLPLLRRPTMLPVIFYFHGGGFIIGSAADSISHVFCADLASAIPAIVVSVEYRLAPEHRLPTAYDDAIVALHWVQSNWAEVHWLRDHADPSRCFLMGTSAGANMAYHVALRALPLGIRGLILHDPFFGGTRRTPKEIASVDGAVLPPAATDVMWELSLPLGADRDHEYCNPTVGGGSEEIKALGWKVLVAGYDGDTLYDHQTAVVEMLQTRGVAVESVFKEGGHHALDLIDASKAKQLHVAIKKFIM